MGAIRERDSKLCMTQNYDRPAPARNGLPEDIAQALQLSQTQAGLMEKVQRTLERMMELARLAQRPTEAQRTAYANEFHTLGASLNQITARQVRGLRLFDGSMISVELDPTGNKLVMSGVDLQSDAFKAVIASGLCHPAHAAQALLNVQAALQRLAIEETIVTANLARLAVLAKQLQKNAALQAARPDRSPPAEESELEAGMGRFTSAEPVPWGA